LLIVSGGAAAAHVARRAKELGFYAVVCDRDPEAVAFAYADSVLIANPYESNETAAAAERFNRKIRRIDGVIGIAADAPATLAALARRLGLAGLPEESARLLSDRIAMRQRLSSAGIAVPGFQPVETPQALTRLAIERGRGLVIRPVDGRALAGVQLLERAPDLDRAFMLARSHSPTERVIVEQHIAGPRLATQSVVVNGRCFTPAIAARGFDPATRFAPFFVASGQELPSSLPADIEVHIRDVVARAAAVLGVTEGAIQGDIALRDGMPVVVDMTIGLAGGTFCTHEIPLATGVDIIGVASRLALGDVVSPQELEAKPSLTVVACNVLPNAGRVVSISGVEDACRIPGVADIVVAVKQGYIIPGPDEAGPAAATVLATGETQASARAAADVALGRIQITTA